MPVILTYHGCTDRMGAKQGTLGLYRDLTVICHFSSYVATFQGWTTVGCSTSSTLQRKASTGKAQHSLRPRVLAESEKYPPYALRLTCNARLTIGYPSLPAVSLESQGCHFIHVHLVFPRIFQFPFQKTIRSSPRIPFPPSSAA